MALDAMQAAISPKSERPVVYSAVFGPCDYAPGFIACQPSCDCVIFTESQRLANYLRRIKSRFKPVVVRPEHKDPRKASRAIKLKPHEYLPGYDISLWVDANVAFTQNPGAILPELLSSCDFALYRHWEGVPTLYCEAHRCVLMGKATPDEMDNQAREYAASGYQPEDGPIGACTFLARRHHEPHVVAFGNAWWEQVQRHSARDQVSWPYVRWVSGMKNAWIERPRETWLRIGPHKKRGWK